MILNIQKQHTSVKDVRQLWWWGKSYPADIQRNDLPLKSNHNNTVCNRNKSPTFTSNLNGYSFHENAKEKREVNKYKAYNFRKTWPGDFMTRRSAKLHADYKPSKRIKSVVNNINERKLPGILFVYYKKSTKLYHDCHKNRLNWENQKRNPVKMADVALNISLTLMHFL